MDELDKRFRAGMTALEKKVFDNIVDLQIPTGKKLALDAKRALEGVGWKKWLDDREKKQLEKAKLLLNNTVSGHTIDFNEFNQHEFIVECYAEYLRMAQLDQRSKVTGIFEKGKLIGKPIIEMSFEQYLDDCIRNLNFRIKVDLPNLKRREEAGLIGIKDSEYNLSMTVCKMSIDAIRRFLSLNEEERFIYV